MEHLQDYGFMLSEGLGFPINFELEDEIKEEPRYPDLEPLSSSTNRKRRPMHEGSQRAQMHQMGTNGAREYRDLEVMHRIYSICENLSIQNPEAVYNLFIQRLKSRFKLERQPEKLELLTAVLYYIDRRAANRTISIRDVLAKLSTNSKPYAIKHFAKMASRVCEELNIKCLPSVTTVNIVRDMLDELLIACAQFPDNRGEEQAEIPVEVVRATAFMNSTLIKQEPVIDPGEQERPYYSNNMADPLSYYSEASAPEAVDVEEYPYAFNAEGYFLEPSYEPQTKYRPGNRLMTESPEHLHMQAERLNIWYDTVLHYTMKLVAWLGDCGFRHKTDVLDASARAQFHCRKTFLAVTIHLTMMMLGITFQQKFLLSIWKAVRSTFYRTCDMIYALIGKHLKDKYHVVVNSRRLLLVFLRFMLNNVDPSKLYLESTTVEFDHRTTYKNRPILPLKFFKKYTEFVGTYTDPGDHRSIGEVKFLHNLLGLNKPYDDRLWKASGNLEMIRNMATRFEGVAHNKVQRRKMYPEEYESVPSAHHPSINLNIPAYRRILKRGDMLDENYALSHDYLNRLILIVGEALNILRKPRRREIDSNPIDDDKLFRVVTYILDASKIETDFIVRSCCIKREPKLNRFSVSHGRLGKRIKQRSFSVASYGLNGAYTMALLYTKALYVANG